MCDLTPLEKHFFSFSELKDAIEIFSKENYLNLYIRDSRKIEYAQKRSKVTATADKEKIIYYSIKYSCIHGGKRFIKNKSSKGERKTK